MGWGYIGLWLLVSASPVFSLMRQWTGNGNASEKLSILFTLWLFEAL